MKHFLFILTLLLFLGNDSMAQKNYLDKGQYAISPSVFYGRILKHRETFQPKVEKNSTIIGLSLFKQTDGSKYWHKDHNLPILEYSLFHTSFGNPTELGNATGIVPSLIFKNKAHRKIQLRYGIGLGLAYLNNPNHVVDNPTNNVIGSHINNMTIVKAGVEIPVTNKWSLLPFFSVIHFSNGRYAVENKGINIASLALYARFHLPKKEPIKKDLPDIIVPEYKRKWFGSVESSFALTEKSIPDGPRYWVGALNANLLYRIKSNGALYTGIQTAYYTDTYYFLKNNEIVPDDELFKNSLKSIAYIGYEIYFGHMSVKIQTGTYIYAPKLKSGSWVTDLGLRYYPKDIYTKDHNRFYVGVNLQTVIFLAQSVGVSTGFVF